MKRLTLFLSLLSLLYSREIDYPKQYEQLSTPLFQQIQNFEKLSKLSLFQEKQKEIFTYVKEAKHALKQGHALDSTGEKDRSRAYLKQLRKLQQQHDHIEQYYKHLLYQSIRNDNKEDFYTLMKTPLPFISQDARLKESVVTYYQRHRNPAIMYLQNLSQDFELDQRSYAYYDAMFRLSTHNQKVQERKKLNSFHPDTSRKNLVEVVSIRTPKGFDLYLENHAHYNVTIRLEALSLDNLQSSAPLPYTNSFPAQSRTKILDLSIIDPTSQSRFQTRYGTQIGTLNPDYDKKYTYALPYERGERHLLSQGFHGEQTHKGASAYALDFEMPIGTPIHAMRDGIVVALEEKNTEHGFSPAFSKKANYIIIQHGDGSMAMYAHLKPNGVLVRLGQQVYKYQKIGLSGNTGYTSGPHLHVHISVLKSFKSGSSSVPFSFLSQEGAFSNATVGTAYTAQ